MKSYLIATGKRPAPGFVQMLVDLSYNDGVVLRAVTVVPGPGCANLAVMLDEPNEGYINGLATVLMPAKWGSCDGDPQLVIGRYRDEINGVNAVRLPWQH